MGVGPTKCGSVFVTDEREPRPWRSSSSSVKTRCSSAILSPAIEDGGRPTRQVASPVTLHVYDLGKTAGIQFTNGVLRALGSGGVFHCGVEVHGREWSYEDTGVFCVEPRGCEEHSYHEAVHMGDTWMSDLEVMTVIDRLEGDTWVGPLYDTISHNCCHFCSDFCKLLGVGEIPERLQELARKAVAFFDALEKIRTGFYGAGIGDPLVCCCAQKSDSATKWKPCTVGVIEIRRDAAKQRIRTKQLFAEIPPAVSDQSEPDSPSGAYRLLHPRSASSEGDPLTFFYRDSPR